MTTPINRFDGKYRFLSNFYPITIEYEDAVYPSTENAYQAAKTLNLHARRPYQVDGFTPGQAKRAGFALDLRPNWENIKVGLMYALNKQKFSNQQLAMQLLDTGDALLEEGNDWGDTFWGTVDGQGENMLGQILMQIRDELRKK